mmetsp:Transcript_173439/g.556326  ORF Transcript_173439/g.556326 Transcript_173439/m.556326 type:complete len:246 (-) Transcript_173439:149-886(-)
MSPSLAVCATAVLACARFMLAWPKACRKDCCMLACPSAGSLNPLRTSWINNKFADFCCPTCSAKPMAACTADPSKPWSQSTAFTASCAASRTCSPRRRSCFNASRAACSKLRASCTCCLRSWNSSSRTSRSVSLSCPTSRRCLVKRTAAKTTPRTRHSASQTCLCTVLHSSSSIFSRSSVRRTSSARLLSSKSSFAACMHSAERTRRKASGQNLHEACMVSQMKPFLQTCSATFSVPSGHCTPPH